jgi:hypothetical protein
MEVGTDRFASSVFDPSQIFTARLLDIQIIAKA